jgi:hypothetical protein
MPQCTPTSSTIERERRIEREKAKEGKKRRKEGRKEGRKEEKKSPLVTGSFTWGPQSVHSHKRRFQARHETAKEIAKFIKYGNVY